MTTSLSFAESPARSCLRRGPGLALLITVLLAAIAGGNTRAASPKDLKPGELFNLTNVWTVHLKFASDQLAAMEPKGGPQVGMMGPGMFLGPAFLRLGDQNDDGKLSKEEFKALGLGWFETADKDQTGVVKVDQLRGALNSALAPPPGGGRGGGPGLNLQGAEGKRNGLASATGIEFEYVHADLEFEGESFPDVAVRYKGNGTFMQSRATIKRSLKIDLNEFVKGRKIAGVTKLNLHNNVTDASWMNEVLSHRLFRDAGVPAPRTAYARVYVTVPGKYDRMYYGLYSLIENVDANFLEDRFSSGKGALLKPVTRSLFQDQGDDWAKYNQAYDPKNELSKKEIKQIIDFCRLVTRADDAEFAAKVGEFLDLEEFARFMAVTTWLSTLDSILGIGQNYYLYLPPKSGKFQFIPWDLDHSFGQFFLIGNQQQRESLSIHKPWQGENRFLERVYKVDAFKKLYFARLEEFTKTIFEPARFHAQVDTIAAAIAPAVKEESPEKMAKFEKAVAGEAVEPASFGGLGPGPGGPPPGGAGAPGGPGGRGAGPPGGPNAGQDPPRFGPPPGFMQSIKPIKAYVGPRAKSVADQLAGKSQGETLEGMNFGPRGGGPGGRGGPGGPGNFGPGMFLAPAFMTAFDADKNGELTKAELTTGLEKWFADWNKDKTGYLTESQLRAGINQDLSPFRAGGPPGGGPQVERLP